MSLLPLVVLLPLLGFIVLAFARGRLPEHVAAAIGVGSVGLSAGLIVLLGISNFDGIAAGGALTQSLGVWFQVDTLEADFSLTLDGLSLTLMAVVTGIGFLIHLFAAWYMRGDDGYTRFFAYMNLFVASMSCLVLAGNLPLLYVGWEGVGLASYLLIGFWYRDPANCDAARKAFVVTRIGDTALAIGLFVLFRDLGTLDIAQAMTNAPLVWTNASPAATLAAFLVLGGAVGKSAQLPLQTWLADAMAGPTPVSALIHAATMVTAGVYLIARTHVLFDLAPLARDAVAVVGAATLLIAGFSALAQNDIKRILAYSTMSQIGYMFLALGVGAWSAAIFHLVTHAFFKALLFLAAGAVILACHHEQNIYAMGGLRRRLPLAFASFVVGGSALAALPLITAGFYSKDEILWQVYAGGHGALFAAGIFGAMLTALYTFRLIVVVFFGPAKIDAHQSRGFAYALPLYVLMALSLVGGALHLPLDALLPVGPGAHEDPRSVGVAVVSGAISIGGAVLAVMLFGGDRRWLGALSRSPLGSVVGRFWREGCGFDNLYQRIFVAPFATLARRNRNDVIDALVLSVPRLLTALHQQAIRSQTGQVRWYATSIAVGAVLIIALAALS